jgi:tetratricopeptide (TPR) repeat protein
MLRKLYLFCVSSLKIMREPVAIPRSEIHKLEEYYGLLEERGILCFVIAHEGAGKTMFLKMIKDHLEETDPSCECIWREVRQMDDPYSFFTEFVQDLERTVKPTVSRLKGLFGSRTGKAATAVAGSAATIATGGLTASLNMPQLVDGLISSEDPRTYVELQNQLIEKLHSYVKKFRTKKLAILIDNLHGNKHQQLIVNILNDIKNSIPQNVMFVVSLTDTPAIESQYKIYLGNSLTWQQVAYFVKKNFDTEDEDLINEIFQKSEGYPAALGWLWENYKLGENIRTLLYTLPTGGFTEKLQNNLFDRLSEEEREILKTCGVLLIVEALSVSAISGIHVEKLSRMLKDFENKGILTAISMIALRDGRIMPVFMLNSLYERAIRMIYGSQPEIYKKAINHYASSLILGEYSIPMPVIGIMLQLYERYPGVSSSSSIFPLLNSVNADDPKKRFLWFCFMNYFLGSFNRQALRNNIEVIDLLLTNDSSNAQKEAWKLVAESFLTLIKYSDDEHTPNVDAIRRISDRLALLLEEINDPYDKTIIGLQNIELKKVLHLFSRERESIENIADIFLGIPSDLHPLQISNKDQRDIALLSFEAAKYMGAQNYFLAKELYGALLDKFQSLSLSARKDLLSELNSKSATPLSETDMLIEFKYSYGLAQFLYYLTELDKSNESPSLEIIANMKDAAALMKEVESHPIYGQWYKWAEDYLLEIDTWFNKGNALLNLGNNEEAIVCYEKAIELDPNDAYAWNNKGLSLSNLARYEEAIKSYDKAIELDPNDATVFYNKGAILYNLARYEEAIKSYDKAIELDPNDANALSDKGLCLDELARYEEAIECHDEAIKLNPSDSRFWYNRACSQVLKGDIKKGLADLKKAIEIDKECIGLAKQDEDFESIRNDERFKALVG